MQHVKKGPRRGLGLLHPYRALGWVLKNRHIVTTDATDASPTSAIQTVGVSSNPKNRTPTATGTISARKYSTAIATNTNATAIVSLVDFFTSTSLLEVHGKEPVHARP